MEEYPYNLLVSLRQISVGENCIPLSLKTASQKMTLKMMLKQKWVHVASHDTIRQSVSLII